MDELEFSMNEHKLMFAEEGSTSTDLVAARSLYTRILWLKEDKKAIEFRLKSLTGALKKKLVLFGSLMLDGKNKAQIVTVGATYSYPKKETDDFINELFQSEDEVEREIARRMVDLRKPKKGYERLDIR